MATRKPKTTTDPAPPGRDITPTGSPDDWAMRVGTARDELQALDLEEDIAPPSAVDRIVAMLGDYSSDEDRAIVKVFRKLPDGKQAWCDEYKPDDFEAGGIAMIRDKYGTGEFAIYLYALQPGTKRFVIRARQDLRIDPSATPKVELHQAQGGNTDATMRMLIEGQQAMLRALTERPAAPDPMEAMRGTLALMASMREAMGLTGAPPQRTAVSELVEGIRELREASSLVNGGSGESSGDESLLGMAKGLIPMIGQVMKERQAQAPAAPPVHANGIGQPLGLVETHQPAAPGEETPHAANEATTGDPAMVGEALVALKMKAYVASLLLLAGKGADPETGAELIYEKLPDEWIDLLELPTWWELFVQQVPQAAPHQAWLTTARDRALAMFSEGGEETETGVRELDPPGGEKKA